MTAMKAQIAHSMSAILALPWTLSLRGSRTLFYACPNLGVRIHPASMQRLTARLLLLFALVGTFAPLALALTAAPPHACCLRKSAHQCHGSDPDQRTFHSTSCCQNNCRRAVTTSQWAHPQPSAAPLFARNVAARLVPSTPATPARKLFASRSTRAPPQISIA